MNIQRATAFFCLGFVITAAASKPNVILIMTDDVSWECFGSYGSEEYETPNLDALAAKGLQFNHCYSQPICTPSRVKIMTGQYNFRNYDHFGYMNPDDKTFGHLMQATGYKTAMAGKWQLNGTYHHAADASDHQRPIKAGFDETCLWNVTQAKAGKNTNERYWSPLLEQNGKFLPKKATAEKYGPDIMSDFVCDFIERHKDDPFFVYYPTVLVHSPFVPTPDTIGDRPRTAIANKEPKDRQLKKENFIAMMNYMDQIIGKIIKKLEDVGQLDNTIILFTSDNGTSSLITSQWQGQQIKGGKSTTRDMGTHVPFIAYWKGHTPKGEVRDDLIDFTDFYATLIEVAGAKHGADDPVDGVSFHPQLTGKKGQLRDWIFCQYQPYWGKFVGQQYVRNQHFKLYNDDRFYFVPEDLKEEKNLEREQLDERARATRKSFEYVFKTAPPTPIEGGRNVEHHPRYPEWKKLGTPSK